MSGLPLNILTIYLLPEHLKSRKELLLSCTSNPSCRVLKLKIQGHRWPGIRGCRLLFLQTRVASEMSCSGTTGADDRGSHPGYVVASPDESLLLHLISLISIFLDKNEKEFEISNDLGLRSSPLSPLHLNHETITRKCISIHECQEQQKVQVTRYIST